MFIRDGRVWFTPPTTVDRDVHARRARPVYVHGPDSEAKLLLRWQRRRRTKRKKKTRGKEKEETVVQQKEKEETVKRKRLKGKKFNKKKHAKRNKEKN